MSSTFSMYYLSWEDAPVLQITNIRDSTGEMHTSDLHNFVGHIQKESALFP
jgi:hypothetical protein